ncbi:universal stress protein [Halorussus salinisoli]|uniref:universal stress protein n=1 Tax=Halorussus salinisoli TaxID=2558242 RepID=UPI0010C23C71|nr:universal stress protein [Halorussus salinisoli]
MNSTVLLPVKNHARWAKQVAEVVTNVEDEDTEAVVLHVFDEDEVESTRANLDTGDTLSVNDLASRKTGVHAAVDVLTDGGLDPTPRGVREDDRTADAILDVAESVDADRVYLYGRKRSPAGKAVFGSIVQRIVLNASVPVTIVPARSM